MKYHYTRSPAFPHLRGGLPLIEIALYHGEHKKNSFRSGGFRGSNVCFAI